MWRCQPVSNSGREELIEQSVFFSPERINPRLESIAGEAGLGDSCGEKLRRYGEPPHVNVDRGHLSADELPHGHVAAGVGEGDVEHRVELIAETGDNKSDASDPWPEQMAI